MQTITKLESLPNELLMQCFGYFHAIDIFHSFDDLNWRFSTLIRNIPLRLDVGKVENVKLTQFGNKLLSNPQIKHQIISLIVKKNDELDHLQTLFSLAPLKEFTHLQALVFSSVDISSSAQISSEIPLLSKLCYFCLEDSFYLNNSMLQSLSNSTVKTLAIGTIPYGASLGHSFVSLTRLTISLCSIKGLCLFFKHSPMLQYLQIKSLFLPYDMSSTKSQVLDGRALSLERLVIDSYRVGFDTFELLLQRTPNLRSLMLNSSGYSDMIDENRWRKLIRDTLPLLDIFKFIFRCSIEDDDHRMTADKFRPFQGGFWHDQHHWYTECMINEKEVCIYTVPYMLDTYKIMFNAKRYYSHSLKNADSFVKVTDLKVNIVTMNDLDQCHFPNVKSLALNNERAAENHVYSYLRHRHIRCLKTMVDLCNLTHLEISSICRWKSPFVISHLLKEALHLSSLKTGPTILFQLLGDRKLCEHLKIIRKLDITDSKWYNHVNDRSLEKICQTFCNMEEFRCIISGVNTLQAAIDHLSKLSHMRYFSYETSHSYCGNRWLKAHQSELDLYSFMIHCENQDFDFDDFSCFDDRFVDDDDGYNYNGGDHNHDNDEHDYNGDEYDYNDNEHGYDNLSGSTRVYSLEVQPDSQYCFASFIRSIFIFYGTVFVLIGSIAFLFQIEF